jgi:nicotinate phosphoribosyltransferase
MQQAVLSLYPNAIAEYEFINRRPADTFEPEFLPKLMSYVESMNELSLSGVEYDWLRSKVSYFQPWYLEYLRNYRFNSAEIKARIENNQLKISIVGPWHSSILWEVPLMATISELHFSTWNNNGSRWNYDGQREKAHEKAKFLTNNGVHFADFGTRRRRSFCTQDLVVMEMASSPNFVGTSNVHLAHLYKVKPIGTYAHEWIQGHSVLGSLLHANRDAMESWSKVYRGNLGIALTDTYGTDAFFEDFDLFYAKLFDGVRHDSGDGFGFAEKVVAHYKKLRIPPVTKTIIFSDSLDVIKAVELKKHCDKIGIQCSFGIGTFFSNDFDGELKPLNIVVKLVKLNSVPVVKLSDVMGKETGDADALRVAKWIFKNQPL